jgi:hypothetical protein
MFRGPNREAIDKRDSLSFGILKKGNPCHVLQMWDLGPQQDQDDPREVAA